MIPAGLEPAILLLRRQSLYPTELRNQVRKIKGFRHFQGSDFRVNFFGFLPTLVQAFQTRFARFAIFDSTLPVGFELSAFFSEKALASVERSIRRRPLYPAELRDQASIFKASRPFGVLLRAHFSVGRTAISVSRTVFRIGFCRFSMFAKINFKILIPVVQCPNITFAIRSSVQR